MQNKFMTLASVFMVVAMAGCSSAPATTTTPATSTPVATEAPATSEPTVETSYQAPYDRIAGYAVDGDLPVAVWVDFDPNDDTILNIEISGYGNPVMMESFGEQLGAYNSDKTTYYGMNASDVTSSDDDVLSQAVKSAADSYLASKDVLIIRPYQSFMSERYG